MKDAWGMRGRGKMDKRLKGLELGWKVGLKLVHGHSGPY